MMNGTSTTDPFTGFRVVAKRRESETITSFELAPPDAMQVPGFVPGQFLVVRLPTGNGHGPILRNYSISSSPHDSSRLRITVKREPPPADRADLPPGEGSNYLHEQVDVGDVIHVNGPRGDFQLDPNSTRPVVLLSGGVGLTPLVSMLHSLATASDRRVYFIHACDSGRVHALKDEVLELASRRPGISTHFCYRFPTDEDIVSAGFHSRGMISREVLQSILPLDDYDIYMCGPPAFMQANYRVLRSLGVPKERIRYEFFGPATVLDPDDVAPAVTQAEPSPSVEGEAPQEEGIQVVFRKSGKMAVWDEKAKSLLDFAESLGIDAPFSCRAGVCNTCLSTLIRGDVEYFEEPLSEPGPGEVLLCCSRPKTTVEVDV
jgi:ferredoxin-NADP reductase